MKLERTTIKVKLADEAIRLLDKLSIESPIDDDRSYFVEYAIWQYLTWFLVKDCPIQVSQELKDEIQRFNDQVIAEIEACAIEKYRRIGFKWGEDGSLCRISPETTN